MSKFEEVLTIKNGRNQKKVENPNGQYPIYGSGGIMGYADNYICEASTVVIGRKGSINNPIYVEQPFWNVDTAFGLVANTAKLFPKYLFYFCKNYDFEKLNTTVTIPSLTKANLFKVEIPLPPLPTQQKIAAVLDKVNDLITERKRQIEQLDLLVKARFTEMFGDPVSNPMGWEISLLGQISNLKSGKNVIAKDIHEQNEKYLYPCYGGNGIRGYVDKFTHNGNYSLIGRQGALCGNVQYVSGKFYPTEHAVVVNPTVEFNSLWLFYVLTYLRLNRLQTGAAQPGLNIDILNNVNIPFAPLPLQIKFAEFVQGVDKVKGEVKAGLGKMQVLYNALMQEYFN